jgi:hypothetical protein
VLRVGITQFVGGFVQLTGLVTTIVVEAVQPFEEVAVNTTLVPTTIPEIVLPLIVPVEAVIVPFVLKVTLYVEPLHIALLTTINGCVGCVPIFTQVQDVVLNW